MNKPKLLIEPAAQSRRDQEIARTVKPHLTALENRVAQALVLLALSHSLGTVRALLEVARRDFDAALKKLPGGQ